MTVKRSAGKPPTPPPTDRRSGKDRRHVDQGPPGRHDRRRSVEPRQPQVSELDMSPSQWGALIDDDEQR